MDNENRSNQKKLFGSIINEADASHLVGGIVEKGFSVEKNSNFSLPFPRPSVVAFPVARHRSHGPHWTPVVGDVCGNNDYDDEENEEKEEDLNGMDQIGAFAKPVQRKEKKGLDFSQWRNIVASDSNSKPYRREESGPKVKSTPKMHNDATEVSQNKNNSNEHPQNKKGTGACLSVEDGAKYPDVKMEDGHAVQEQEEDLAMMDIEQGGVGQSANLSVFPEHKYGNGIAKLEEEIIEDMHPVLLNKSNKESHLKTQKNYISVNKTRVSFDSWKVEGKKNASSLESQIDAENRARLAGMSTDEIAEAQAAIVSKLSPAVLEALKRRGQEKLKRETSYISGSHSIAGIVGLQDKTKNANSQGTSKNVGDDIRKLSASTNVRDAWSKRVESVRDLRFSLEGNVITNQFEGPYSGSISGNSCQDLSNRDYLRTEGDPGAAGYTIKEAISLTGSVVPAQRALALRLIASVLDRSIHNICQNELGCNLRSHDKDGFVDWEAIWAYTLGPEPELSLSLRICLDDNHDYVVMACTKAILHALSFETNEEFSEIVERIPTLVRDTPTAPVFRGRPEIADGFLRGGFWKYNAKPSNIHPFAGDLQDNDENEHTIQDDVVVAGQDIAAGLIRMGILERVRYFLENDPSAGLEEYLISILIALARHSPTCATAIMKCQRLVQMIINRFTSTEPMKICNSKIKSVALLKVLARFDKGNCLYFINTGILQKMTWHLYRYTTSLDQWVESGKDACKLSSSLLVEQLRLWKVCVQHGYCVSCFADLFPALCIWLKVPTFEKLIENSVLSEYAAISMEAYLVLGAFARRLPTFYSDRQQLGGRSVDEAENWCWVHAGPMIDSAVEWLRIKKMPILSHLFEWKNEEKLNGDKQDSAFSPLLWLISSIMDMLATVLEAVVPSDSADLYHGTLPWIPDFVPDIGLEIIKNGFMGLSDISASHDGTAGGGSFLECLCYLRKRSGQETSLASSSCLQGLLRVARCVDKLISLANSEPRSLLQCQSFTGEEKILADGILNSSLPGLRSLMSNLVESNGSEWRHAQSIETFGRGGPAPGIGVGWGSTGGGFWSKDILLAQVEARLFIYMLDVFPVMSIKEPVTTEAMNSMIRKINSVMGACLILGPIDSSALDKLLDFLFQVPILKYIDFNIRQFLIYKEGFQSFELVLKEEDYSLLSNSLASHFKKRWLSTKQKTKSAAGDLQVRHKNTTKGSVVLDTIPEENSASSAASQEPLVAEWAHQRLPLPLHWFLSPLSVCSASHESRDFLEVAKGGLFFLLGIEVMSTFHPAELSTPVQNVPVVWKLHALSAALLSGTGILEEDNCRDLYKALQDVYGQLLDREKTGDAKSLRFKTEIHESYSTFIDSLVEQFAAVSYGDVVFGRQVGVYLHRFVEAPVRLAAWNALSYACALELLPPLEKCIAASYGYLEPVEDDERILEAYCKSWVSGSLDKASSRGSASFTLALHHLSSFIFQTCPGNMLPLRNKLVKSLLRDCSRKKQHEVLFIKLFEYQRQDTRSVPFVKESMPLQRCNVENRLQILKEACIGNSALLDEVEKLSSVIRRELH